MSEFELKWQQKIPEDEIRVLCPPLPDFRIIDQSEYKVLKQFGPRELPPTLGQYIDEVLRPKPSLRRRLASWLGNIGRRFGGG